MDNVSAAIALLGSNYDTSILTSAIVSIPRQRRRIDDDSPARDVHFSTIRTWRICPFFRGFFDGAISGGLARGLTAAGPKKIKSCGVNS